MLDVHLISTLVNKSLLLLLLLFTVKSSVTGILGLSVLILCIVPGFTVSPATAHEERWLNYCFHLLILKIPYMWNAINGSLLN